MRIEDSIPIDGSLPEEHINMITALHNENIALDAIMEVNAKNEVEPWYTDVVNYLAIGASIPKLEAYQRKKFYKDI